MSTPVRFERLLNFLQKTNPAYNIQLAHLESAINRRKLQTPGEYRNSYRRIKALVGPNYNARVARGRQAIMKNAATLIQKHWRGTRTRKPKVVLVQNPNNGNIMLATSVRVPTLTKIHTAKVSRNTRARLYGN
jgi:acyl-homoserine lactone acylase PvdQ